MFDQAKADRAVKFINSLCHTQDWHGKPFDLMPWEEKIISDLFGTVNEDGTRQYREAYISTARKNGKSELSAAIALYCLYGDGVNGAEIYCNAGDRDQAGKVYSQAAEMVEQNPILMKYSKIVASTKRIIYAKRDSFLRVLSHEASTKHGFNVSCAINDEVHIWPNRKLYTVMKTGTGVRLQPLIINVTTAGYDRNSLCWELYDYAKKIRDGILEDPTFYSAIFELEQDEDWKNETNWYKANPGLGIYRLLKELKDAFKRACDIPAFENEFRQLYLNQWTEQAERWLPMDEWDANDQKFDVAQYLGKPCFAGLDLASSVDIAAFVRIFQNEDGEIDIDPIFFIPADNIQKKCDQDRVRYDVWVRQGYIQATPGNVIDYAFIEAEIEKTAEIYDLQGVVYDRWGATQISQRLTDKGIKVIPMGQGFASMSSPTKELMKLVLSRKVRHNANPVLRWMASNMVVKRDPAGNLKPDRSKNTEKIDGMVATIMALDLLTRTGNARSVYEDRGVLTVAEEEPKKEEEEKKEEEPARPTGPSSRCLRCGSIIDGMTVCPQCGRIASEKSISVTV